MTGELTPARILGVVDQAMPGANACLNSPLWQLLTDAPATTKQLHDLLWRLDREIFELVWKGAHRLGRFKLADKLERLTRLDALAAEILLLRLSALRGHEPAALHWGQSIWRMMLLLGPCFVKGGIAQALADLVEERIMPMATVCGEQFGFPSDSYNSLVWQYVAAIYLGLPPGTSDERLQTTGLDILNGTFGSAYFWTFNPERKAA